MKKIVVEVEVPEGVRLEDLLRGVKYRIFDPVTELEDILESAERKRSKDRQGSRKGGDLC